MQKYENVKSLNDLRLEQVRLEQQIEYKEQLLKARFQGVKTAFSFPSIMGLVLGRVTKGLSMVESVVMGFDFVKRLISRFRTRKVQDEPLKD